MAKITKIVCAVDFSDVSAQVADYAVLLAKQMSAEVLVLHVAHLLQQYVESFLPTSKTDSLQEDIVASAEKAMKDFTAKHFPGLEVHSRVVTGSPAEEIVAAAKDKKADLIVMGSYGRTGIDRVLVGSVAEKVVKSATIPVLIIHP